MRAAAGGIEGILQQIDQDLLHLHAIGHDLR